MLIILKGTEKLNNDAILKLVGKIQAVIYARVSSADQAKKGYSLDSQIERCAERALQKFKIKNEEIIALVEQGEMGDNPNRPALNHALRLLESGLGSKLIVLHPDRLARDVTIQGVLSKKIWGMGVDIEFVEFEVDPTNPESMLMYNIQGSIAQYNKAKILANSRRGRIQKAKKGEMPSFRRLYGYELNKETQKLEINEEEHEVLMLMKEMILEKDMSCNQIAKELSRRSIPAPNGKVWYQATVSRMLRNETYKGVYYHGKSQVIQKDGIKKQVPTPKEKWIPINIPVTFDEETFKEIQNRINRYSKNKGRKSKTYLLKGIARCGRCGSAAGSGITSKVKSGTYRYYACRKKGSKGYKDGKNINVCKGRNWRVDIVDEIVWDWLVGILENPVGLAKEIYKISDDIDMLKELEEKKKKLNKRLKEIDSEENNYLLLFGKGKITEAKFDELTLPLNENKNYINEELKVINNQLATAKKETDEVDKILEYTEQITKTLKNKKLTIEEKRKIVRFFIHRVNLYDDDTIEIISKWGDTSLNEEEKTSSTNQHKKQNHVQTYGGQTA